MLAGGVDPRDHKVVAISLLSTRVRVECDVSMLCHIIRPRLYSALRRGIQDLLLEVLVAAVDPCSLVLTPPDATHDVASGIVV